MLTYILRRVALVPVIIVGVMTIVFALTSALPVQDKILAQHQPPIHAKCGTPEDLSVQRSWRQRDQHIVVQEPVLLAHLRRN